MSNKGSPYNDLVKTVIQYHLARADHSIFNHKDGFEIMTTDKGPDKPVIIVRKL